MEKKLGKAKQKQNIGFPGEWTRGKQKKKKRTIV